MPSIETYRKQAKLLVRWHRERNYSVGEKVRLLERYRHLTDVEVLEMAMPLTLAFARRCRRAGLGWRHPDIVRARRCCGRRFLRGETRLSH